MCAVHGKQAPATEHALALDDLEQLSMLPLGHWEGLYYAVVGEVRRLYEVLREDVTSERENGNITLHTGGRDGLSADKDFTALNFASMLEEMHFMLMDQRLIGPLEIAVRREKLANNYRDTFGDVAFRQRFDTDWAKLNDQGAEDHLDQVRGMIVIGLLPEASVLNKVFDDCMPAVRRACQEVFAVEVVLPQRDAPAGEGVTDQTTKATYNDEPHCLCSDVCSCKLVCQFEVQPCVCEEARTGLQHATILSYHQQHLHSQLSASPDYEVADSATNASASAVTDEVARMQEASTKEPHASHSSSAFVLEPRPRKPATVSYRTRPRGDTSNSDLAYVPPPRTPMQRRPTKDAMPLGFYGYDSPQRYPKFNSTNLSQPSPVYGPSLYSANFPSRRPIPFGSTDVTLSSSSQNNAPDSSIEYSSTLPSSSPPGFTEEQRDLSRQGPYNKSLSSDAGGNDQQPVQAPQGCCPRRLDSPKMFGPFSPFPDSAAAANPPQELGRRSEDVPKSRSPIAASTEASLARKSAPAGSSPDLPDFIAPRPALKQRYVSAGGNAKLADRPEIPGFALPPATHKGMAMSRQELEQRLEQNVRDRKHSGTMKHDSAVRSSNDSPAGGSSVGRVSREVEELVHGEKRDRTGSNSSFRALKRVFSRQNSQSEADH